MSQNAARSAQRQPAASSYVNEHEASGGGLQELRLGFFADEQEARTYAASLPAPYTNSIVVVAGVDEQDRAAALSIGAARAERRRCRSRAGGGTARAADRRANRGA